MPRMRGSSASRRPSPRKVKASTTSAMQMAGASSIQGWALIAVWPSSSSEPQLVMKNWRRVGGGAQAQAQVAQDRLGDDQAGDQEGGRDDQRAEGVGQQVA